MVAALLGSDGIALAAGKKHDKSNPVPQPTQSIPLAGLGLHGTPTAGLLRSQAAIATLDFVDNDRILLTFLAKPLMTRDPDADSTTPVNVPPSATRLRQDRVVHAEIINIKTGTILEQQDWRVFDREPYLVPLGHGEFILREGGRLSIVDAELRRHSVSESREAVVYIQAELGSNLLLVEKEHEHHTAAEHAEAAHEALLHDTPLPPEQADVYGWKLPLTSPPAPALFHALLPRAGVLTGTDAGLVEVSGGHNGRFELFFTSYGDTQPRRLIFKINSDCRPATHMLRHDVLLVTVCKGNGNQQIAVNLTGEILWKQPGSNGLLADFSLAENGKRYAVQSVGRAPIYSETPATDEDFLQGLVQVLDVDTGARLFATVLTPLYGAFRTAALSPDGSRIAMLRRGALEIYDLPPLQTVPLPAESAPKK